MSAGPSHGLQTQTENAAATGSRRQSPRVVFARSAGPPAVLEKGQDSADTGMRKGSAGASEHPCGRAWARVCRADFSSPEASQQDTVHGPVRAAMGATPRIDAVGCCLLNASPGKFRNATATSGSADCSRAVFGCSPPSMGFSCKHLMRRDKSRVECSGATSEPAGQFLPAGKNYRAARNLSQRPRIGRSAFV
jgi:hypothetical protein